MGGSVGSRIGDGDDRRPPDQPVDLTRLLARGCSHAPDAVAIATETEQMTWRELDEAARRLATGFGQLGVRPGDRLASLMPNGLPIAVLYLACLQAGLVMTPLNYRYTASGVDHALEVSEAAALVAHVERADVVAASTRAASLPLGLVGAGGDLGRTTLERLCTTPAGSLPPPPDPSAPAAIFFTSGSTGPAKGVTHSLASLGWMVATGVAAFELTDDDVFLPASSLSHLGATVCMLSSFAVGARVVVARTADAGEVFPLLRAHRPTVLAMLPAALAALVRDDDATADAFASLRLCRVGSDAVPAKLHEQFSELTGLLVDEGYGMTEVGIVALSPPSGEIRRGSMGLAAPGVTLCLVDDDGAEVASGEVGRILIRAPSVLTGYWRDPGATAQVLRDGWFDSGDLARIDADGYLWFVGRRKHIIVHDGSNISPLEVERALAEHPAVSLAVVVGIPDEVHGENVWASVTLAGGAARPTVAELVEFARERVGYRAPAEIEFLDAMPLTPAGKVDRLEIERLATRHRPDR
ncbi:MAG TPA: class I adenylate-forming enzyme family protein [Acidimicrobiia bacterium]|nr:class I adenylate-forming enzyme family protein [Acidimicrobiia bacterium]